MVVIAAVQFDRAKERLHGERTPGIAFLQGTRRLLVGKKLRVGQEPREQAAGVPMQGGPEPFLQPLRASAQTLLADQPRAG